MLYRNNIFRMEKKKQDKEPEQEKEIIWMMMREKNLMKNRFNN